ncbi:MAG: NADH-quinone oxidoreductase subunit M [Armatimonadetes bacterium]|nr:NADH-quinone oxidoreductase subunit M [Armatimonadota bacterium]
MNGLPLLNILIFVPIVAGIVLALAPQASKVAQVIGSIVSIGMLVLCGALTKTFIGGGDDFQYRTYANWIPTIGANYFVGVDSVAVWMMLLTAFLTLIAVLISKPAERSNQFFGLLLCLEGTLFGVFSSLDLLLFYTFFELSLIPVALMILGWGSGQKGKSALRYVGVLFAGSLLMLVGITVVGNQATHHTGQPDLNLLHLQQFVKEGLWANSWPLQSLAFWGFMIAFLVKSPVVPMHRWLADTYEDAPIGAIVAGVVLKVGTFGMFRFVLPLFPDACRAYAPIIVGIGVVGIVYGGILAAIQKNPGRLMAFSTVSHVGYILIGLFSLNHYGMMGAAFQQVNHGIAAAAVFVLLSFLYDRTSVRSLDGLGGLKKTMPIFSTLFLVAMLTNLGLPFTSGFVGEILALLGAFTAGHAGVNGLTPIFAYIATGGAVLSAGYLLYMYQRMFYGKRAEGSEPLRDLNPREMLIGTVFAVIILVLGILPMTMLRSLEPRVQTIQAMTEAQKPAEIIVAKPTNPDLMALKSQTEEPR